jgi:LysM repeat protein
MKTKRKHFFVTCLVLVIFFQAYQPRPLLAKCSNQYVVKKGDSWWSIARKSETTLNRILKLNGAKTDTKILIGDEVCVPGQAKPVVTTPDIPRYTQAEVIQIIRDAWPDDLERRALFIAHRESKYQPGAINRSKCCYGLFQIYYRWHKSWLPEVGVTSANQLLDPRLNAAAAYRMYQRNNGWGPWK